MRDWNGFAYFRFFIVQDLDSNNALELHRTAYQAICK